MNNFTTELCNALIEALFKKEFIIREAEFLRKGGALIFPLPKFEIFLND